MGLSKAIPPQAQEHGFLSRYLWIYSDKSGKIQPLANDEEDVDPLLLKHSNSEREQSYFTFAVFYNFKRSV